MFLVRTYYQVKPFLPHGWRLTFRRWRAERQKRAFATEWPIKPAAARRPIKWQGWPQEKEFALVLTHDVEGARGLERCRALAEIEISYGVRSSFNFVPEGEYRVSAELRRYLLDNGFEVGVHDLRHDGKLYWSRAVFRRNAGMINQYLKSWDAVGFRSGFMHHNLDWIHDLDVLYDSSTFDTDPFEPQPDGVDTIFPFWVPAPSGHRPSTLDPRLPDSEVTNHESRTTHNGRTGYVELPYTLAQDFTLFLLLQEESSDTWKRKLDWIAAHGGMAMLDVHPDYVDLTGNGHPGVSYPLARYREFIEYVQQKYAGRYWHVLPKEVASFAKETLRPISV